MIRKIRYWWKQGEERPNWQNKQRTGLVFCTGLPPGARVLFAFDISSKMCTHFGTCWWKCNAQVPFPKHLSNFLQTFPLIQSISYHTYIRCVAVWGFVGLSIMWVPKQHWAHVWRAAVFWGWSHKLSSHFTYRIQFTSAEKRLFLEHLLGAEL